MKVIESVDVLEGFGAYLASVALAQFNSTGDYLDHPDLPAVLFAGADVPDTALVLTVTGFDDTTGVFDLSLTFRAPGIDARGVDGLADAVFAHFETVMGAQVGTFEYGSAIILPTLVWGELEVLNVERMTRGTPELSSDSRNTNRKRYVRTDQYKVTVSRDD